MKKTCTLLLVMALLLTQFSMLPVHADDLSGDFYFIENADTTTVTITGYTDTAPRDHVVIPQAINGKLVTAIGVEAFQNKSIQSLELPEGLVSIGRKAFYNNLLISLDIPGSVKNIDQSAFQTNDLTSLTINDGVEKIGITAFAGNEITDLHLPDSVTELGGNAFQGNQIVNLSLSNNLTEIGDYAFNSNKLISLDIPDSVQVIGRSAFSGNRIVTLVIPETVTTVKKEAFHYNALESVTFLGTPILEDDMDDVSKGFFNQFSNATNSDLYNWYLDPEYTEVWDKTVTATPASPLTIYAAWQRNYVTFNTNGGSGGSSKLVDFGETTTAITSTKTEHALEGWYTDAELNNQWDFNSDIVTRNITLYAKWVANTYTVNFQSNGGTPVAAQTIAYDNKVVPPAAPSKAGHTFGGWYTNSSLTTPWNFDTSLVKGNTTLYAKWTTHTYTVNFQSNGGTAVAAQTIAHDEKVVAPTAPSKAGHIFTGWYSDEELTTPWNFATDVVTEDRILYAGWDKEHYTVSFESNGGTAVVEQEIAYDEKVIAPAAPSKAGHTFDGWYTNSSLTTPWNFDTSLVKGNTTLYAKWSRIIYVPSPEPIIEPEPTIEPKPLPEEELVQDVCSTDFTDTSNHWAEYAITDIASRCIIIGYPDGEFKPNAPIIRAHVAVMFARALALSASGPATSDSFYDVSNNSPYYEAILKVSQAGIFEGTNGYFRPDQQLTRAQMAKILVIAFHLPVDGKSTFQDVPESHWASSYIATLESYGLASGEDGHYKPQEPVTRAQFAAFMYRALQLTSSY